MNLRVLPYVAALMVPAVATGATTTFVLNKFINRQPTYKPRPGMTELHNQVQSILR